ncbi:MAG TPA: hypothetical protein VL346_02180 [Acidobacteriaceae bacterium]|nr:hypothetical protein [Acidobacteriaceae bacterium]
MADSAQSLAETVEPNSSFQPNSAEAEILLYIYNRPSVAHSTVSLAFNLRAPKVAPDELPQIDEAYTQKQQQDLLTLQTAVESLILAQYLEGAREALGASVQFTSLKLTQSGEKEAIRVKRNLQELPSSHSQS